MHTRLSYWQSQLTLLLHFGPSRFHQIWRNDREGRPVSTDPASGINILFHRALFAWQIANSDMHLKNLAVLNIAEADAKAFTRARFAPLYDALTTRVFPSLEGERMALKLNSKDDRLTRQDFYTLACTIGVSAGDSEAGIADCTARVADRSQGVQLPALAPETEAAKTVQEKVIALVGERCTALAAGGE